METSKTPWMSLAVLADKAGAVNGYDHLLLLQRGVVQKLIEAALKEGRIDGKTGINPLFARPSANATACSSAMPISKNLYLYSLENRSSPVPMDIAAVMAQCGHRRRRTGTCTPNGSKSLFPSRAVHPY